jgi:hypothetical protein
MKEAVDNERKAQGLGVDEECSIDVPAAIEGPYGQIRRMGIYDGVVIVAGELTSVPDEQEALLIAGGSGISFAVSHMLQAIRDAKDGKPHPKEIKIIWMVKSRRRLPPPLVRPFTHPQCT